MASTRKERTAAVVAIYRGTGSDLEVFLAHRAPTLRYFGDYLALPGGVRDPGDGPDDADGGDASALRRCALREIFEETGVLLDPGMAEATHERRDAARRAMLGKDAAAARTAWNELQSIASGTAELRTICRIRTPAFAPVRYDTVFFLAELPPGEEPQIWPGELIGGGFQSPEAALKRWMAGEQLIVPPVIVLLELWQDDDLDRFVREAEIVAGGFQRGRLHRVRFSPGILMACLETPTLPPATTTNCYIVGTDRLWIIDPGTPEPEEQTRLFELLDELQAEGATLEAVICTHHHPDHVGAVPAVSQRYGLPVRAHSLTLERLGGDPGDAIADGDRIDMGRAPDGSTGWYLEAIFTPGHDQGHLAFRESRYGALIAGDMVSTVATIMIDPPEGHMATYLQSLRRLAEVPMTTLYPAHGPAAPNGHKLIQQFIEHRQRRQAMLEKALAKGPSTVSELLPKVYWDVAEAMYPFAARSLLAGLQMLAEEGRANVDGGTWSSTRRP